MESPSVELAGEVAYRVVRFSLPGANVGRSVINIAPRDGTFHVVGPAWHSLPVQRVDGKATYDCWHGAECPDVDGAGDLSCDAEKDALLTARMDQLPHDSPARPFCSGRILKRNGFRNVLIEPSAAVGP